VDPCDERLSSDKLLSTGNSAKGLDLYKGAKKGKTEANGSRKAIGSPMEKNSTKKESTKKN